YAPVDIMVNHLRKEYVNYVDKIKLLPHGFDSDELPASINKTESPIKRILFYGSIYNGLDFEFDSIANSIKENNLEVKIDIYSDSKKYMNVFIDRGLLKNKVNYYSALPSHELFQLFQNYDYILLIHPDYGKDNLSTKFFEIIHTRTPIIYIGSEGKTGQFIRQNDLGYHFTRDEIYDSFAKIINNNLFLSYNSNFVTDDYSFELLTKKLISEFK
ncbi:MAG: hypothetical protein JNL69_08835, partial [Bacteroidia bacterium]|nr:hypothetical protein [Bacteroidia bacterium]